MTFLKAADESHVRGFHIKSPGYIGSFFRQKFTTDRDVVHPFVLEPYTGSLIHLVVNGGFGLLLGSNSSVFAAS